MIEKERIYNNSFRYKDVDDTYNPPPLKPYEVKNVKFKKFIWITNNKILDDATRYRKKIYEWILR